MQNRKGLTLIELIVVIVAIVMLAIILLQALQKPKINSMRLICGTNLKGLGSSMYVYAYDYDDQFPVLGGDKNTWSSTTAGWDDPDKDWSNSASSRTVSASLYLLVRYADVGFKSFICPKGNQQPFEPKRGQDATRLWDFGPDPANHQSYSYQFPYGSRFAASGSSLPENAIMADRSPWFDENLTASSIEKEDGKTYSDKVALIDPQGKDNWKLRIGNSQPHDREGQNVLFGDSHVSFEKRPDVASKRDNIFTIADMSLDDDSRYSRGIAPTAEKVGSVDKHDSLLVSDRRNKSKLKE